VCLQAPAHLRADWQLLTVLRQILIAAQPEEGCALLLGVRQGHGWQLGRIWPCRNVWSVQSARNHRFAIDPREQLLAQKWGREQGLEVLGSAHSHPASGPVPSATDCRLCVGPALMVILGAGGQAAELLGWWIPEPPALPQLLPWRIGS
jgi:proteasome lid subunit RPN8/RPN11